MDKDQLSSIVFYKSGFHRFAVHSCLWIILFAFTLFYQSFVSGTDFLLWDAIKYHASFLILDILFTYLIIFYIDHILLKKKYLEFILITLLTILLEIFIYRKVFNFDLDRIYNGQDVKDYFSYVNFTYLLNTAFFPIGLFSILHLFRKWIITQSEKAELISQNLKNELNLLKTQLNQHFLFNTLNNIDSMIYYDPDKASRTVINLSGLLRYALYETNQERVPMFQEIDYIKDYLEVFSIRMTPGDKIEFLTDGDYSKITIAPMLFLPFIENTIKFCDRNYPKCIIIRFSFKMTRVEFEAFNWKKIPHQNNPAGLGISNVKRRLELLYPERHTLSIDEDLTSFKVRLILETGEDDKIDKFSN